MTAIEWTHRPGTVGRVWNPVTGCTKVSAGCKHCYAETVADRFWATQYPHIEDRASRPTLDGRSKKFAYTRARCFTDVQCHEDRLAAPLSWKKPATVFVNSMSDLFHEAVPDAFIDQVFAVMALCPGHTFIVLTKRPGRMNAYLKNQPGLTRAIRWAEEAIALTRALNRTVLWRAYPPESGRLMFGCQADRDSEIRDWPGWPLPNVWLGVSVEDQATADERIPWLLDTPSARRFVSAEPLLGPVNLTTLQLIAEDGNRPRVALNALTGHGAGPDDILPSKLDWLIVGGESGPQARPCDVAWIRSLKDQATAAGVPCFVKQLGSYPLVPACRDSYWNWSGAIGVTRDDTKMFRAHDDTRWRVLLSSRKGSYSSEWPHGLRVREWPA